MVGAKLIVATELLASGELTRRDLCRSYVRVYRNVYTRHEVQLTAADRARAAWLWSSRQATLVGHSAAAVLGSKWIPDDAPVEIARVRRPATRGIVVRSGVIRDDEVGEVDGMRCTIPERTAYDLGRRLPLDTAIIRIDALLNATGVPLLGVEAVADRYPGARGIRRLRAALDLVDSGAESPQETRLRLLLVRGGLPRPVTQIRIPDPRRRKVRRIDMGYPEWKVGVEYEGEQHWTNPKQYEEDIERLEFFAGQGWLIVRVSARQLRRLPDEVIERARTALLSHGFPAERTLVRAASRRLRTTSVRSA